MRADILAQGCEPKPIGQTPPTSPVGLQDCSPWSAALTTISQWTLWISLVVCLGALIILLGMIVIDKNKGEAGIASSIQSTMFRYVLGAALVSGAGSIASALFFIS